MSVLDTGQMRRDLVGSGFKKRLGSRSLEPRLPCVKVMQRHPSRGDFGGLWPHPSHRGRYAQKVARSARDGCLSRADLLIMVKPGQELLGLILHAYGVTTGQAVAPLVVQTMRPWIAGLTGVVAAIRSANTSSM